MTKLSDLKSSAQTAADELLGTHQPAITRSEAGSHEPSLATLARLSSALGISLDVHIAPAPAPL